MFYNSSNLHSSYEQNNNYSNSNSNMYNNSGQMIDASKIQYQQSYHTSSAQHYWSGIEAGTPIIRQNNALAFVPQDQYVRGTLSGKSKPLRDAKIARALGDQEDVRLQFASEDLQSSPLLAQYSKGPHKIPKLTKMEPKQQEANIAYAQTQNQEKPFDLLKSCQNLLFPKQLPVSKKPHLQSVFAPYQNTTPSTPSSSICVPIISAQNQQPNYEQQKHPGQQTYSHSSMQQQLEWFKQPASALVGSEAQRQLIINKSVQQQPQLQQQQQDGDVMKWMIDKLQPFMKAGSNNKEVQGCSSGNAEAQITVSEDIIIPEELAQQKNNTNRFVGLPSTDNCDRI